MDTSSVIIGLVLLLISIVPIVFIASQGSKSRKKLKQKLLDIARENNSTIELTEMSKGFAIGIDFTNAKLYYVKEGASPKVINLSIVKQVDFQRTKEDGESEVIDLLFYYNHKEFKTEFIRLNDLNGSLQIGNELKVARSVVEAVNSYLKKH